MADNFDRAATRRKLVSLASAYLDFAGPLTPASLTDDDGEMALVSECYDRLRNLVDAFCDCDRCLKEKRGAL